MVAETTTTTMLNHWHHHLAGSFDKSNGLQQGDGKAKRHSTLVVAGGNNIDGSK
jgi:hypothetical protein